MPQGSFSTITAFTDFSGAMGDITWGTGEVNLDGGWGFVSVNEGSVASVTDEEGGILQFTTDTADNDNVALIAGPFKPSNGTISMEVRFQSAAVTTNAIYAGFSETLALGTPVMPAEFATATMTYNGSGGMLGAVWDPDATTNRWKAVCGDGGAVSNASVWGANGTDDVDSGDSVNDEWDIIRVELSPDGYGRVIHDENVIAEGATGLTTTDIQYAVLMLENRSAAASVMEVDYCFAQGARDWTVA